MWDLTTAHIYQTAAILQTIDNLAIYLRTTGPARGATLGSAFGICLGSLPANVFSDESYLYRHQFPDFTAYHFTPRASAPSH